MPGGDYFDFDRRAARAYVRYNESHRRGKGGIVTMHDIYVYQHERLAEGDATWAAKARDALHFLVDRKKMRTSGRCRDLDEVVREILFARFKETRDA